MVNSPEKIEKILQQSFQPIYLKIQDESARHMGHPGAKTGGGHYHITLVSDSFEGKSLLEQHQLVNRALKELFSNEIHALALETYSPLQWKQSHH